MRRLCLILLCGLVAVPTALAARRAVGDGVLELSGVNGTAVVNGTSGTLWGQMGKGRIVVSDPIVGDGQVFVSGWVSRKPNVLAGTTVYVGNYLRFRITGGKYRLTLKGNAIDLTAVGVGLVQLSGDPLATIPGSYAIDSGKWLPVPYSPVSRLVSFGVQPATAGSPSSTP